MASQHGAPPVFNNKVIAWIDHRLPIFSYIEKEYHTFPTPRNFNYFWNFGAIATVMLVLMIATGVVLATNYTPHVLMAFDSVERIKPSFRNELEITDAIQDLIDRGLRVMPHLVSGWWKDTGKLEDMLEANRIMLDALAPEQLSTPGEGAAIHGRVGIGANTAIVNSVVRGPAIIGDGVEIRIERVERGGTHDGGRIRGDPVEA